MPILRKPKCLVLDIEGTTSSIQFVHEVMFPYVRRELSAFLSSRWEQDSTQTAVKQIAIDEGYGDLEEFVRAEQASNPEQAIESAVTRQMDADLKANGLKQLQGLIWKQGFETGELKGHVYPDVVPALKSWKQDGIELRIYSSGSVAAQHLFFGFSIEGDLLPYFAAHYDTSIGSKKSAESYREIAKACNVSSQDLLFISDSVDELKAAVEANWNVVWSCREENPEPTERPDLPTVTRFSEIQWGEEA